MRADGTDVCDQYKVLMIIVILDIAGGDKMMAQVMKTAVTEKLRSKSKVEHLPPKAATAEKSFEVPTHSKKSRMGTHLRGGKAKKRAAEDASDYSKKKRRGISFFLFHSLAF